MTDESSSPQQGESTSSGNPVRVALRIALAAPPLSVQTVPLEAAYFPRGEQEPLDLVRLTGIEPEIFNLFSGQVQAVVIYRDDQGNSPHIPDSEVVFKVALGAARPEPGLGMLDTGTKQKDALVASEIAAFTVLDLQALYNAIQP